MSIRRYEIINGLVTIIATMHCITILVISSEGGISVRSERYLFLDAYALTIH